MKASDTIRHVISLVVVSIMVGLVVGGIWIASVVANSMKPFKQIVTEQQQ